MHKTCPPGDHLIQPLVKHFQGLLEFYIGYPGFQSSSGVIARISLNFSNIQNVFQNGLQQGHPNLANNIYGICYLNDFSLNFGQGILPLFDQIYNVFTQLSDHRLKTYYITELFKSWRYYPASNAETLFSQALEHFDQFDDPDLKCKFYISMVDYYRNYKRDISTAHTFCQTALSLAISTGNTKRHIQALSDLAWINLHLGDYVVAQQHAYEAQRLARVSADLFKEAQALRIEAICCSLLGDYRHGILLCNRARDVLALGNMSGSNLDHAIMTCQAEIHRFKSEYFEARYLHTQILTEASMDQDPFSHALALFNVVEIDVATCASKNSVQNDIDKVKSILNTIGDPGLLLVCDCCQADLYLRDQDMLRAQTLLCKNLRASWGNQSAYVTSCLERLGDFCCWNNPDWDPSWTILFLMHSIKSKQKLGIHKALKFLGDIFFAQDDEETAISLFTIALEGFTGMDVHCGRAECMLQLGVIFQRRGDLLKAQELWEMARPLFERSSQAIQVEHIDKELARIGGNIGQVKSSF